MLYRQLTGFNFRNSKNIIDNFEQVVTAKVNNFGELFKFWFVVIILNQQGGKSHNCIHGCSDFMAHVLQKRCFKTVAFFSLFFSFN